MRFYPYPALVTDFTVAATQEWSPTPACQNDRFDDLHDKWLDFLNARGVPVAGESLYGFPEPSNLPCSAVSQRGWVVNFDGELHKCGLDSDMEHRAVGALDKAVSEQNENGQYWSNYEPVADPTCRACPALPVCLGGCARDRREERSKAMAENCRYHLQRQPEIVAHHVRLRRQNANRRGGKPC
ncbi:SPASM domain-containing protein [Gilvimarinus sp. DZF01]|uniref:SPASM domain-containing protein n=1 Tax=Gilvimarinus sp. DZF01 TaxID=3461371 RepID=UPI0040460BA9